MPPLLKIINRYNQIFSVGEAANFCYNFCLLLIVAFILETKSKNNL